MGEAARFDLLANPRTDHQHLHVKQLIDAFVFHLLDQVIEYFDAGGKTDVWHLHCVFLERSAEHQRRLAALIAFAIDHIGITPLESLGEIFTAADAAEDDDALVLDLRFGQTIET